MFEFTLGLAGRRIAVEANYERTLNYCRGYLTEGPADFSISIGKEDVFQEHLNAKREQRREGRPVENVPIPFLERMAVYRKIADKMLDYDTLLFHGSAISVDGEGYLFTALSGTGKSTHTRLWREYFGERAVMVNDDKPLLRVMEDRVMVCGTPWNGKHELGSNIMVPLKGICVLNRGEENTIRTMTPAEALPYLFQQCHRPPQPVAMTKVMALLDRISHLTGLYCLHCNMNPEAALVAYNAMKKKEI